MTKKLLKSLACLIAEISGLAALCSVIGAFLFLPTTPSFDKPYVAHALEIVPMLVIFSLPLSMLFSVPYVSLSRLLRWNIDLVGLGTSGGSDNC